MVKRCIWIIALIAFFCVEKGHATHIRAGNILSERLSTLTFRFTLIVYTNTASNILDEDATFDFGDGTVRTVPLTLRRNIGSNTLENLYVVEHTFPAPGLYRVGYTEVNRTGNILNIGNSVNTPFFVETAVLATAGAAGVINDSPTLLFPPLDKAQAGQLFVYNPGAYDKEGDSISYRMVIPKQSKTQNVFGYYTPQGMTLNPVTGDLVWNVPQTPGLYNIAFIVEEWRNGVRVGYITRDMQIEVLPPTVNKPPVLSATKDTCILAGTTITEIISATDPNGDPVRITTTNNPPSGVYALGANFSNPPPSNPVEGVFDWTTSCAHVRGQAYNVDFKATDIPPGNLPELVDYQSIRIKVIAPAPVLDSAKAFEGMIRLHWKPYSCPNANTIAIYRKDCDSTGFIPQVCEESVPAALGYTKIAEVPANSIFFEDTKNISQGTFYCYMLVAQFPFPGYGSSYASTEVCASTDNTLPLMGNVSVIVSDSVNGEISVNWIKPSVITQSGPFLYHVYRSTGLSGNNYQLIGATTGINDTSFTDGPVNSFAQYNYKVELVLNNTVLGASEPASVLNLTAATGDRSAILNFNSVVPWEIKYHKIFKSHNGGTYSMVDSTVGFTFNDRNLINCDTFCYYVESYGEFCSPDLPKPLVSRSAIKCVVPFSNEIPLAPVLSLKQSNCALPDLPGNELGWIIEERQCEKIVKYNIYYSQYEDEGLTLLTTVEDTSFFHKGSGFPIAGCYAVTAVNAFGTEGEFSNRECIDICVNYALPNLITPNGDGKNDIFIPLPTPRNVRMVEFKVFNRWGQLVHRQNNDIFLNWPAEGLPDGVYYYQADVHFFPRLRRKDEHKLLKGWVHIFSRQERPED
ncbi:MAG: gliding motility-associated C-terminal domain-containing protein [Cytophagaceae bacterium]